MFHLRRSNNIFVGRRRAKTNVLFFLYKTRLLKPTSRNCCGKLHDET